MPQCETPACDRPPGRTRSPRRRGVPRPLCVRVNTAAARPADRVREVFLKKGEQGGSARGRFWPKREGCGDDFRRRRDLAEPAKAVGGGDDDVMRWRDIAAAPTASAISSDGSGVWPRHSSKAKVMRVAIAPVFGYARMKRLLWSCSRPASWRSVLLRSVAFIGAQPGADALRRRLRLFGDAGDASAYSTVGAIVLSSFLLSKCCTVEHLESIQCATAIIRAAVVRFSQHSASIYARNWPCSKRALIAIRSRPVSMTLARSRERMRSGGAQGGIVKPVGRTVLQEHFRRKRRSGARRCRPTLT